MLLSDPNRTHHSSRSRHSSQSYGRAGFFPPRTSSTHTMHTGTNDCGSKPPCSMRIPGRGSGALSRHIPLFGSAHLMRRYVDIPRYFSGLPSVLFKPRSLLPRTESRRRSRHIRRVENVYIGYNRRQETPRISPLLHHAPLLLGCLGRHRPRWGARHRSTRRPAWMVGSAARGS